MENTLFCANCQDKTAHTSYTDHNGEHVFVCSTCNRAIKLPAGITPEDAVAYFKSHEEFNRGQVSMEAEQKLHEDITAALLNAENDTATSEVSSEEIPTEEAPTETPVVDENVSVNTDTQEEVVAQPAGE